MANICYFEMCIRGKNKDSLKSFYSHFDNSNINNKDNKYIPRTSLLDNYKFNILKNKDNYYSIIKGECCNSCFSCFDDTLGDTNYYALKKNVWKDMISVNKLCRKYYVDCEVFSYELSIGFMEHLYFNSMGKLQVIESDDIDLNSDDLLVDFDWIKNKYNNYIDLWLDEEKIGKHFKKKIEEGNEEVDEFLTYLMGEDYDGKIVEDFN